MIINESQCDTTSTAMLLGRYRIREMTRIRARLLAFSPTSVASKGCAAGLCATKRSARKNFVSHLRRSQFKNIRSQDSRPGLNNHLLQTAMWERTHVSVELPDSAWLQPAAPGSFDLRSSRLAGTCAALRKTGVGHFCKLRHHGYYDFPCNSEQNTI